MEKNDLFSQETIDDVVGVYPVWRTSLVPIVFVITLWVWIKKSICLVLFKRKPRINSIFLDRFGGKLREIRECSGTSQALDLIYNHRFGINLVDDFWFGVGNACAVRNRRILIKNELRSAIIATGKKDVRILEIASGSAQALYEVSLEMVAKGIIVHTFLLDKDEVALNNAHKFYTDGGIKNQIQIVNVTKSGLREAIGEFNPDIIEIVGLIDYLKNDKIVRILKTLYTVLPKRGILITANIAENYEKFIIHTMFDWPKMFYRSSQEVESMIDAANFKILRSYCEPLKIYSIVVAEIL